MKAVLDIGKTNVKLQLVDDSNRLCHTWTKPNTPLTGGDYPHADVEGIWQWLVASLRDYHQGSGASGPAITDLVITTHGATAALIDHRKAPEEALVLPLADYEYPGFQECDNAYQAVRPDFSETCSPDLPAGLNLGRQIFWLQQRFPADFAKATHLLMYPQYWGWRLTGEVAAEVTSLGCHTDLWSPVSKDYSSLVRRCQWQSLMPPLKSAWEVLGQVTPAVAAQTGLPVDCCVYVGLHDSNASYLRYLFDQRFAGVSFSVISTGTWTLLMRAGADTAVLASERDMLANCDVRGNPVSCARFMGGREYARICQQLGGDAGQSPGEDDIQTAIDQGWMATPDFSEGNGPFGGRTPGLHCPQPAASPAAIATLYCALMIDQRLADLGATGPLLMEGAFLKNSLLCQLLAQLRPDQPLYLSADDTGTVQGALLLTAMARPVAADLQICPPGRFRGLADYRARWYACIESSPAG